MEYIRTQKPRRHLVLKSAFIASFCLLVQIAAHPENSPGATETEEEIASQDVWHAAKLRGVSFRAVGQEPGWLLEITNGERILLVTDYGQKKTTYPYVEPAVNQEKRKTVFTIKERNLEVVIKGKACADSMSGEMFDVSVFVIANGRQLVGCGRALH